MSKQKEKFENKKQREDYFLATNFVFQKVLNEFYELREKFNETEILKQKMQTLTFNDAFVLMFAFRALHAKELDKIVEKAINNEIN